MYTRKESTLLKFIERAIGDNSSDTSHVKAIQWGLKHGRIAKIRCKAFRQLKIRKEC